ncbi:MAG: ATP synthase F1 subunit delta [Spirochaetaceae bacterium]|nr:ATP synthase F1 subunit delta [Spirochaetaceae bacterium]|tara:strand:- start:75434 stop:75997 length:564 start_codon:yes stop_codon:yes gene_type:complete
MSDEKIGNVYAEALLDLAAGNAAEVEQELQEVNTALHKEPLVWKFFAAPVIDEDQKLQLIQKSLKGNVSQLVYNFLGTLCAKERFHNLPDVVEAYSRLLDEQLGRKTVILESATELDQSVVDQIRNTLKDYFKMEIVVESKVKPSLLGGIVVRSNDVQIDTSLFSRLKRLEKNLLTQKILGEEYYEN